MKKKLYQKGMSLREKLLIWYKERYRLDMVCGDLHENTMLLKEAANSLATIEKKDREYEELNRVIQAWTDKALELARDNFKKQKQIVALTTERDEAVRIIKHRLL
jgi:Icc-related predicted phosphoesterase